MLKQILGDVVPLGHTGVLAVMVFLLMTGRLVPLGTVLKMQEPMRWHIDQLKLVNATQAATIEQQADVIVDLMEGTKLSTEVVAEIKSPKGGV